MMKTKPVATTLLVVMAIIFLISYPHRHDALWAFIMHVSGAAMIGGLADWYAVTALFTKPLGIPFKTAILPRSKERLIQIGRTMLSEELLRVPQMYYAIKRERVMVRIIEYGMSDVGQKQMRELLYGVGNQVLSHMDIEPMRKEINKAVYKGVSNWKATPLVILFGRCMLERHTASVFWLYFNRTCQRVIASNQVYPYLYRVMLDIMKTYTKDSFMRELAYPHRHDALWAFIMHVSGAAMIGGLADWYAVTALFTKPLGIPFKTAILPRSKERLIQIGRTMLSEELLRVPQMYYAIKRERVMVRIIEYGMSDVGQKQMRELLYGVGNQVLSHMDIEPMRKEINKAVYKGVSNWKATPLVILFGRCMLERHTASVFWLYFNRTCQRVIASNQVYPYLYRVMLDIMKTYTKDSFMRELAIAFGGDGLSPERLVDTVQKKAVQFLQDNEDIDSPLGRYIWGQAIRFFNNLETNEEWQAFIEEHKDQWVKMVLEEWEGKLIDGDTLDWVRLMDIVLERFNVLGSEILLNPEKQAPFERFFLLRSIPWLQKLNPLIDRVVGEELSRYSPDEITHIIRGKMYYDLQMVRINGSLVGAVLGGLFYGVTLLIKGVIG